MALLGVFLVVFSPFLAEGQNGENDQKKTPSKAIFWEFLASKNEEFSLIFGGKFWGPKMIKIDHRVWRRLKYARSLVLDILAQKWVKMTKNGSIFDHFYGRYLKQNFWGLVSVIKKRIFGAF